MRSLLDLSATLGIPIHCADLITRCRKLLRKAPKTLKLPVLFDRFDFSGGSESGRFPDHGELHVVTEGAGLSTITTLAEAVGSGEGRLGFSKGESARFGVSLVPKRLAGVLAANRGDAAGNRPDARSKPHAKDVGHGPTCHFAISAFGRGREFRRAVLMSGFFGWK